MRRNPDPERLLRGFYADELRAISSGRHKASGRSDAWRQGPARTIRAAAAALAIIAGSAMAERPAAVEAPGIAQFAAAFSELAEARGLLEPFKAWAEELKEQENHDDT
ncbi:MAG TPA: hypothetical protein DCG47_13340 [Spirochaetaceae bacterium]|jgi:hypothetical protein|nr:hypothetical protein [Spirochaetaceae bacterium]